MLATKQWADLTAKEIQNGCSQDRAAMFYARTMTSEHQSCESFGGWRTLNEAITARWPKGLQRVKEKAHKLAGKPVPDELMILDAEYPVEVQP